MEEILTNLIENLHTIILCAGLAVSTIAAKPKTQKAILKQLAKKKRKLEKKNLKMVEKIKNNETEKERIQKELEKNA